MQLVMQPFGIANSLRWNFLIPVSATGALAATVAAPKSTGLYTFCGARLTTQVKRYFSHSFSLERWTLFVATCMMVFSATWFVMLETDRFSRIRAVFDKKPWRNTPDIMEDHEPMSVELKPDVMCPFTARNADGTCPICHSIVSHDGYYHVSVVLLV